MENNFVVNVFDDNFPTIGNPIDTAPTLPEAIKKAIAATHKTPGNYKVEVMYSPVDGDGSDDYPCWTSFGTLPKQNRFTFPA